MPQPGLPAAASSRACVEEHIASGGSEPSAEFLPVAIREFVSRKCGAEGVSTGTATFPPGAELATHLHGFSEAITILAGEIDVHVQGRCYRLSRLDSIHLPAGIAHRLVNPSASSEAVTHWAFASAEASQQLVNEQFAAENRGSGQPAPGDPEYITRISAAVPYPLAPGTRFYDLFAGRFGSVGICGGYGEFEPGTSLPCHTHQYDESITIITGQAVCQVAGKRYSLAGCDTAFVPEGRPHRFLNQSDALMAMIWIYAGSEPERTLVATAYCDGSLVWPLKGAGA
jgi:quercetin dioxygenase-like cupin family protein